MGKFCTAWDIFRKDGIVKLLDASVKHLYYRTFEDDQKYRYIEHKARISGRYTDSPIFEPIEVDPESVKFITVPDKNVDKTNDQRVPEYIHNTLSRGMFSKSSVGQLRGGEWDKSNTRFVELPEYKSIKNIIQEGVPMEKTEFGKRCINYINAGHERRGFTDAESYINHREELINNLCKKLKNHGYKSQKELNPQKSKYENFFNEIRVNIGRDGQLLFNHTGGHHRLALAKLLNLDSVIVSVIVRHRKLENK